MKPWQLYIWAVFLMMVWLLPATASAEERKDEWKQAGYAFADLKLVLIETEFGENVQADDLKQRILIDKVRNNFSTNLHFAQAGLSFLSQEELRKRVSATSSEDMAMLAKSDPARYSQLLKEGTALYCQGILQVRFSIYQDTVHHIPEHVETYETTKQVQINKTVTDSNGKETTVNEWVNVPVTETRAVPARDEITAHTGVEVTLFDVKSGQPVWKMVDNRDALGKNKDGMIDRTLRRAAEHLEAVKKS